MPQNLTPITALGPAWWDGDVTAAAILGVVQGITEFLPISSSGHLAILPWAFQWSSPVLNSLPFAVALHVGTLLAVLLVFWRDVLSLAGAFFDSIRERDLQADPQRPSPGCSCSPPYPGWPPFLWKRCRDRFRAPGSFRDLAGLGIILCLDRGRRRARVPSLGWQKRCFIVSPKPWRCTWGLALGSTITMGCCTV